MGLQIKCDWQRCDRVTDYDHPNFGWIKVEPLSAEMEFGQHVGPRYYCSHQCNHDHSYLLISGDNGK